MRAFASSFHAWKSLERQEGIKVPHGLVFPLAVVEAIGAPHGLTLAAEEHTPEGPLGFDAVFISVLDSRCMVGAAKHFKAWQMPFRRQMRSELLPLVVAGGQGLHNPLPMADVADVIFVGDAEDSLPLMLQAWHRRTGRKSFLADVAAIKGIFVPSVHDRRTDIIDQAVADDIGITLRQDIRVSNDGSRRVEIARGCKYKCAFCSLGWRTPVRENSAAQIIETIKRSPKRVHLQAGDAESHSGIDEIRTALRAHGGSDQGWTGRLDSLFENPDQTIPGQKRYAFGVEGVSYRLRRAVGKGYLTDDRLVDDTVRFFESIEGEGKGRGAWHIITGLPGERAGEEMALARVIDRIDESRRGKTARNLALHWQPFQPLPGTPMQWCGGGTGARKKIARLSFLERNDWCRIRQLGGRSDSMALVCTVLARSDERGALLLEAMAEDTVTPEQASQITGAPIGPIDPDAALPWDFIRTQFAKPVLRRAYDVMLGRLSE
jgi:hypothetical protein